MYENEIRLYPKQTPKVILAKFYIYVLKSKNINIKNINKKNKYE